MLKKEVLNRKHEFYIYFIFGIWFNVIQFPWLIYLAILFNVSKPSQVYLNNFPNFS